MTTDMVPVELDQVAVPDAENARSALAHYLGTGDLSKLAPEQRAALYLEVCRSLRINARTRPLDWIEFYDNETKQKKLTLYPNKSCTDQLAYLHRIRVRTTEEKITGTLFKVAVLGTMPDGRTEENVAYVDLTDAQGQTLRGQRYGNALMKCHTKAKRRLILGMVGMSIPDDDGLPGARRVVVDAGGNIIERPTAEQRYLADNPHAARAIGEPTFEDLRGEGRGTRVETGFEDEPDLPVHPDPGLPARTGPRPTFKPTDEEVNHWLRSWHAAVKDLSLDDDDARHTFVEQWTNGRTRSLRNFFASATEYQANDLLGHVRALMEDEKRALLEQAGTNPEDEQPLEAF
jgi:hypothetical protein